MNYFLVALLLLLSSCASGKYPHSYFVSCEEKFNEFTSLSSCALNDIREDCEDKQVCKNENSRFVNIIKRLQLMVDKEEISENEAMFRYLNLIEYEESKFKLSKNNKFRYYHYYPNNSYLTDIPNCYYSETRYCY